MATFTVALAGNPNSGKTTIFNGLTGLRQKVANYPGITVEKKTGRCKLPDGQVAEIIDLPGTYSLISRSPDELVAMEVLRGLRKDTLIPDVVVVVVDASNLQRNLYLVSQLIELGRPMVVALNMMDIAIRRGIHVSTETLSRELGVPVIPVVGHKKEGIEELKGAIVQARVAPLPDWPLPEVVKEELALVGGGLSILQSGSNPESDTLDHYRALAERLLIGDHASDLASVAKQEPVCSLLQSAKQRMAELGIDPMQADIEAHYRWIEGVAMRSEASVEELAAMGIPAPRGVLDYESQRQRTTSEEIDAIFIHKIWGLLIFAAIMGTLFVTIFWLAKPIMDGIQTSIEKIGDLATSHMANGPLRDLVHSGIFKGVGSVVVFVPQIALLFLFLAILEDSGYLSRAAFLMDRLLAKVGLHGKSFIPLLSSFACAIPGIMATRTIENRKDRLATILVAPFMSCSARLPVYTLLIGTFFSGHGALAQAGIMLALYSMGIAAAAGTAWVFKRSLLRGPSPAFILEMPSYKVPQASQVARTVWVNTKEFLTRAGTTIFCMCIVLWAMMYYPRLPEKQVKEINQQISTELEQWEKDWREHPYTKAHPEEKPGGLPFDPDTEPAKRIAAEQLRNSIAGRIGHGMEPALRPLGYDWKMGVGLIGAFAAREVFVSTMGIIYSVGETGDDTSTLQSAMQGDRYTNGKPAWTPLVAGSLLVWFVLAMQCMSTMAVVRRETGGWKWPIFMLVYMNVLAYVVCLGIYQVGRFLS